MNAATHPGRHVLNPLQLTSIFCFPSEELDETFMDLPPLRLKGKWQQTFSPSTNCTTNHSYACQPMTHWNKKVEPVSGRCPRASSPNAATYCPTTDVQHAPNALVGHPVASVFFWMYQSRHTGSIAYMILPLQQKLTLLRRVGLQNIRSTAYAAS